MADETLSKKKPPLSIEMEDPQLPEATGAMDAADPRALEEGVKNEEESSQEKEKKLGHKFFFFCCDSKRAVVWLNTATFILNLFTLTAAVVRVSPETEGYTEAMVVRGCGMFVTLTTLIGAYSYSRSIVGVGLLFTCYQLTMAVLNLSKYNWGGYNEVGMLSVLFPTIWYSMVFYADGVFIAEVNDGIMTAETYKRREKYSCLGCCC